MDYNIYLLSIQDKIKQEDSLNLKLKFEQLQNKEEVVSNLALIQLQNTATPIIASIISACLGLGFLALDRFMIKDYALGLLRLVLSLFPCILFLILGANYEKENADLSEIFFAFFAIFLICGIIWWGVYLFLVYKKIKKENYNKIIDYILKYQKI
ncbi:hypothetical protein JG676_05360 [Campylobacter sp. 2018MI35]|uniref:hypothetical protein n=1 Tax=Campylobacter sp. 2018MI34 TaxID=2800582 RepID=UPI0019076E73|nr:hypothetical protein [Campylobacter sp. 2018MI34]MBK1992026.1 hypothetical protein [Campylobacter sp. 2018MI34]